jgi:hypothetical protein
VPYPRQDPGGILFDFHPAAAAIALLAAPKLPVYEIEGDSQPRWQAGQKRNQRLPVRFPRREVFQHYQDCSRLLRGGQFRDNELPDLFSSGKPATPVFIKHAVVGVKSADELK